MSSEQTKKSKKIKREKSKEQKISEDCHSFLEELKNACFADHENNKKSLPSLNRLSLLENVNIYLNSKKRQEILLDNGLLDILKMWLEPMPDYTLPNIQIKKTVLENLYNMPITKTHLLNSSIGKIVHFYSKNARESSDVQHLAKNVMKKWTNIVFEKDEDDS
ncbi:hypothetical protein EDEG_02826 [Edhazardia aedis USNM 41457]|uniref:TFIIS N-terminal domain-containing protein n=1 Tax=Edhazardia aedis (strain USNM 41457) TaxID=1003232 RepID=J9D4Q0_EDHAE|nr:hypothetical protein EDEG_02826 [Edhazardia aedis USNM 41457]|eukprot:EJW02786.1 hypothetical protein EDEG_02826 [Edhazardia aedis USNM 41457]